MTILKKSVLIIALASTSLSALSYGPKGVVREYQEPYGNFEPTHRPLVRGDVAVLASKASFGPVIQGVAKKSGISLTFANGIDQGRKVTAAFNNASAEDVIRELTLLAGYVAVYDAFRATFHITDSATYQFRMPSTLPEAQPGASRVALQAKLQALAGTGSSVLIEDSGRIVVKADGFGLKKVHQFLRAASATTAFEPLIGEAP